ncbi:hypothetical protein BGZ83_004597 [Gryganskiella cystojenkinii]|nr:hypothetical protein BGZ83_004597 [Gryganskiella cystojenkinii]
MFDKDSDYQNIINKINGTQNQDLRYKLSIPQMAIIGDQSAGKSSVLEAITGLSFPRDRNLCTRFATMVNLRQNTRLEQDQLSARIEGQDDFNKKFHTVPATETIQRVILAAVAALGLGDVGISGKVLEITLSGPKQTPLTVIDLPGFTKIPIDNQDKDCPRLIHEINTRYIQDERTIILAVIHATQDLAASTALAEAAVRP